MLRADGRVGPLNATRCDKWQTPFVQKSLVRLNYMNEAEKDAEISSLKNLYEEEKQIVTRIWEFLGSPSFEELKGRTLYDLINEKE